MSLFDVHDGRVTADRQVQDDSATIHLLNVRRVLSRRRRHAETLCDVHRGMDSGADQKRDYDHVTAGKRLRNLFDSGGVVQKCGQYLADLSMIANEIGARER